MCNVGVASKKEEELKEGEEGVVTKEAPKL